MRNTDRNFDILPSMFKLANSSIFRAKWQLKTIQYNGEKQSFIVQKSPTFRGFTMASFSELHLTAYRSVFTVIKLTVSKCNDHRSI